MRADIAKPNKKRLALLGRISAASPSIRKKIATAARIVLAATSNMRVSIFAASRLISPADGPHSVMTVSCSEMLARIATESEHIFDADA